MRIKFANLLKPALLIGAVMCCFSVDAAYIPMPMPIYNSGGGGSMTIKDGIGLLIALNIPFEQFSNNKKLHYNPENNEGINKPIPKNNFLKELAYRLGVEIDVSLMSEEEIYDFIKAMGHTETTIQEVEEEIKNIRYKG